MKTIQQDKNSLLLRYPKLLICIFAVLYLDVALTAAYNTYDKKPRIIIPHPVFKIAYKKNSANQVHLGIGGKYSTITNSLGFKDKTSRHVALKSANHRILFMGDSVTNGWLLNYEDSFVGLIEKRLQTSQIEVLNGALPGDSPILYWRKTKYLIESEGLQFNEVVLFLGVDDYYDERRSYLTYNLNVRGREIYKENHRPFRNKLKDLPNRSLHLRWQIVNHTTLTHQVLNFLYDLIRGTNQIGGEGARHLAPKNERITSKKERTWALDKHLIYKQHDMDGIISMKKYLNRLLKLLRSNGISLTIAVYPNPSLAYQGDLKPAHVKIWEEWCQENSIKFISFFPDFIKTDISNTEKLQVLKQYYLPGDLHFNKKGHKVIAHRFIESYLN
jgi:lysophospholipase L1-like esterase